MRIGIDVGGTFTDVVLIDDLKGEIHFTKTLTTPGKLPEGVLNGIEKIIALAHKDSKNIDHIVHGTTIGTNTLIQRNGAVTGLLTTEGFRDVLEIGRIQRPAEGLYDFNVDNPEPLVPRRRRLGVVERIGAEGEVVTPLDENSALKGIETLKNAGVQSVAVCFLFSFLYPEHEKRVRELIEEKLPGCEVSLSCETAPEFREFERTSTTVIDAYLKPGLKDYITKLHYSVIKKFECEDLRVMQASGGNMTAEAARDLAVRTVNSGPAGGALAGAFIGKLLNADKVMTVDMGGTSFDIGICEDGKPRITSDGKFAGFPVKIPIIDVHAIGAGGGSIAWIDEGGALNIGPQSAGADPGPVCYGQGGKEPTVTDANLVLGRLNPDFFLGGEMKLSLEDARHAIKEYVADPLGLSIEEAAAGIIRLVNAAMVKGMSSSSIEKGYDVRDFILVGFGGAGPLHAVELSKELGIKTAVIPPYASALSALGLLEADTQHDFVQTVMMSQEDMDPELITGHLRIMEQKGLDRLAFENIPEKDRRILYSADLRYEGQSYDLNISLPQADKITSGIIKKMTDDFEKLHRRIYQFEAVDERLELVNLRVRAVGLSPPLKLEESNSTDANIPASAQTGNRKIYFHETGFVDAKIYRRDALLCGNVLPGPCAVEETTTTTIIPQDASLKIDRWGNLVISI